MVLGLSFFDLFAVCPFYTPYKLWCALVVAFFVAFLIYIYTYIHTVFLSTKKKMEKGNRYCLCIFWTN